MEMFLVSHLTTHCGKVDQQASVNVVSMYLGDLAIGVRGVVKCIPQQFVVFTCVIPHVYA